MSDTRQSGRSAQPKSDGEPLKGSRNERRAYEFQQRKAVEGNWADAREFEERPPKPKGPTKRSQAWRNKKNQNSFNKDKPDDAAAAMSFRAKDETSPIDEPMYDIGPHTSSIPIQELYSQNFEMAGYIDQVERTYESLRGIDPRLDRRMPFSMFQHSMCTILNCHLIDVTLDNGERKMGSARCQDLLPEDLCMPDNLYHFCTNIGNTTTATGDEVKFNLPDLAIPRAAEDEIPSGTFGPVNADTHNVYECYISPLVTANRVLNSRRNPGDAEIPPLPAILVPAGYTATPNLLGHGPPDIIPTEARPRIQGFDFPDGDSPAARLKICPELMARVNTVLFELRSRYKMRDIGRSSPNSRNYIVPKHIPGNVTYVQVEELTPDTARLSKKQNQIRSYSAFGSASAGMANVTALQRYRSVPGRGHCYVLNNAAPPGNQSSMTLHFNLTGC